MKSYLSPQLQQHHNHQGFSLIEMMVAVALLSILLLLGSFAMADYIDRHRLKGEAESVRSWIANVRQEAVRANRNITLEWKGEGAAWCLGANTTNPGSDLDPIPVAAACNCQESNACVLEQGIPVFNGADSGVAGTSAGFTRNINGALGTLNPVTPAVFTLQSPSTKYSVQLTVSPLGQTTFCTPDDAPFIAGISSC